VSPIDASGRSIALVTGASGGIGAAFAKHLARLGNDIIVTARRRERLEALAERLRRDHGVDVEVVVADLADAADLDRLAGITATRPRLTLLVNNAGFGGYGPFASLDAATVGQLIDVHVRATVRLSHAALPGMLERGRGAVVNVASLLAFSATVTTTPPPLRATYAGAKSFVVAFTQLLAAELAATPVRAMVVCPGVVRTEFHEIQGIDVAAAAAMSADDLVAGTLLGLERGEVVCAPALEDESLIAAIGVAQRTLLGAVGGPSATGELAARYLTERRLS
jgi:short-subunit dehydrogenase